MTRHRVEVEVSFEDVDALEELRYYDDADEKPTNRYAERYGLDAPVDVLFTATQVSTIIALADRLAAALPPREEG